MVVHSTDIYLPLDINQSPFNVSLSFALPEFDLTQMKDLANRHQFQLEISDLDRGLNSLIEMIGGYPYLARLEFYALSTQKITLQELLASAPTASGIYRQHLQQHLITLQQYPELGNLYQQVVTADAPVAIPTIPAYKLESIGLVKLIGDRVVPSCRLYRLYFQAHL